MLIFNKFKHSSLHTFSLEYPNTEQDYQDTKETIDFMKEFSNNRTEFDTLLKSQKIIYALLLKAAIISFRSKNGIRRKVTELMDFINNELGIFLERETVFCYWFLKNRNDDRIRKFFRGVQLNSEKIIKTIQGMSWDLFHLRICFSILFDNAKKRNKVYQAGNIERLVKILEEELHNICIIL